MLANRFLLGLSLIGALCGCRGGGGAAVEGQSDPGEGQRRYAAPNGYQDCPDYNYDSIKRALDPLWEDIRHSGGRDDEKIDRFYNVVDALGGDRGCLRIGIAAYDKNGERQPDFRIKKGDGYIMRISVGPLEYNINISSYEDVKIFMRE